MNYVFHYFWTTFCIIFRVKSSQRSARTASAEGSLETTINSEPQRVDHQFKKSLHSGQFKNALSKFLLSAWQQPEYSSQLNKRSFYITIGEECYLLRVTEGNRNKVTSEQHELFCNHEEADSRMLLYASHGALHGSGTILLKSPDTDVAVIALGVLIAYQQG